MKPIMISLPVLCLLIITANTSSAQKTFTLISPVPSEVIKKNITSSELISTDSKVYRNFEKQHPMVENVHWALTKEGYVVRYEERKKRSVDFYNHKGKWFGTITYLSLNEVPEDVAGVVRNAYSCYEIFFAQQVRTPRGSVHVVKIEHGKEWKTLKVQDGNLVAVEEFHKPD